jgi:hypothetical protein
MALQKVTLPGVLFVASLYVLAIICYVIFRFHFFAFCFGLAAILATVSLLTGQCLN